MIFPEQLKYVLDADTLMRAARTHYSFDIAQVFWDGLLQYAQQGIICSIDKVLDEINNGNDELVTWANNEFSEYFITTQTSVILENYARLIEWAQSQNQYNQNAKDEFYQIDNADAWIIAFANTKNLTIVTHEKYNPDIKRKIPIPNVCEAFNIQYIDLYQMLKDLGFKFK